MKLLLLGGTGFLGRHLVEAALSRRHTITLFHRGQTYPDLFPDIERIKGDREKDLAVLKGRHWNSVIDTCGYLPRMVRDSAQFFSAAVDHYTFISTLDAYGVTNMVGIDESYSAGTLTDPVEEITATTYGPLKALCEQAAENALPGRVLIIRPGLIVGPSDPTDRFSYWPRRMAQGGEILVPDRKDQPVQFIDVRDLAQWTIHMVEMAQTGIYNTTGPDYALTLEQVLEQCRLVCESNARFTWVSEAFLTEHEVMPWMELPLCIPSTLGVGLSAVNSDKAMKAGLTFRPLAGTIRDTLAWEIGHPTEISSGASLKPEREKELLKIWNAWIAE